MRYGHKGRVFLYLVSKTPKTNKYPPSSFHKKETPTLTITPIGILFIKTKASIY